MENEEGQHPEGVEEDSKTTVDAIDASRSVSDSRLCWVDIDIQDLGDTYGRSNTNTRSKRQHETNHDASKVCPNRRINDDENMFIPEFAEAQGNTCREGKN